MNSTPKVFAITILAASFALLGQIVLNPPKSAATFTSDVDLVNVLCVVRNKKGAYAKDLTKADFEVREDGKLQSIQLFAKETDSPLRVALLIDTSGSVSSVLDEEKQAARLFFQNVLRTSASSPDMALLGSFDSHTVIWQGLTDDKKLLDLSIDKAGDHVPRKTGRPTHGGTVLFDAVHNVATNRLKSIRGRKVMVLLTDGIDSGSQSSAKNAVESALKSDTVIYAIHYDPTEKGSESNTGIKALNELTSPTGGRTFRVDSKHPLEAAFKQIEEDMRSQYAIGYKPLLDPTDGAYRKLEVKVKGGLKAQTRSGYYAVRR